jgi:hypothetical protein
MLTKSLITISKNRTKVLVLDISKSKLSLEEAAKLAFSTRDMPLSYNKKRDLLILEFETPHDKIRYMKRLPQWLWNKGCVIWEYTDTELQQWMLESMGY